MSLYVIVQDPHLNECQVNKVTHHKEKLLRDIFGELEELILVILLRSVIQNGRIKPLEGLLRFKRSLSHANNIQYINGDT